MSASFALLLFCGACFVALGQCAAWCPSALAVPVRVLDTDDDLPSLLVFAGHESQQLSLRLAWPNASVATVLLPPSSPLRAELGGGELAAQDAVTMARILISWRETSVLWRTSLTDASSSSSVPQFNLGAMSSWWLRYAYMVNTGSELIAYAYGDGGGECSPRASLDAHDASSKHQIIEAAIPLQTWVQTAREETRLAEWPAITIRVDLSRGQTLLPSALLAELFAPTGEERVLVAADASQRAFTLLTSEDILDSSLVTTDLAQVTPATIVIGRRLARRLVVAWAANASGIVAVALANRGRSTEGVSYMLLGAGLVAAYLLGFWTTMIGLDGDGAQHQTRPDARALRHIILLAIVGTVAHIFGPLFLGSESVVALNVSDALRTFALAYYLPGSCMLAALLVASALSLYMFELGGAALGDCAYTFAATHFLLITRTLIIALLPAASRSLFGALVLAMGTLVLVLLPSIYVCTVACARTLANGRAFRPWNIALCIVSFIALGLLVAGTYEYLLLALLSTINARYAPATATTATLVLVTAPALLATFLSGLEEY